MSTDAQIRANQQNAQHSTGPSTDAGKAASCQNNFRHGLTGAFRVLPSENQEEFDRLAAGLQAEHQPTTLTELMLVEKMAQHYWLSQRAQRLQDMTLAAKYNFLETPLTSAGTLRFFAVLSGAFPLTNYQPDFQPLSIGNQSRRISNASRPRA